LWRDRATVKLVILAVSWTCWAVLAFVYNNAPDSIHYPIMEFGYAVYLIAGWELFWFFVFPLVRGY